MSTVKQTTGYDKLAAWHGEKDEYIQSRADYMQTPAAYATEWRASGNAGFPPDWNEYKARRFQWLSRAIAEFKKTNPAPLDGAGNMVEIC